MSRPAYMIIAIDVRDPSRMAEYAGGTQPLLEAAGARVLAATNGITVEDGTWPRERIAILEFPSMESARSFWKADAYAPMKALREAISTSDVVLVAGTQEERVGEEDGSHYLLGASTMMNADWVEEYMQKVPPISARFGVKMLAGGPEFETLDGVWPGESVVLLRFPSHQAFRDFWHGEEYRPMKELREANAPGHHISFAGIFELPDAGG